MSGEAAPLRDVAIIGGGCYGTFYARQLETAHERGKLELCRVLVVDRDPGCRAANELRPAGHRRLVTASWDEFLLDFLPLVQQRLYLRIAGNDRPVHNETGGSSKQGRLFRLRVCFFGPVIRNLGMFLAVWAQPVELR